MYRLLLGIQISNSLLHYQFQYLLLVYSEIIHPLKLKISGFTSENFLSNSQQTEDSRSEIFTSALSCQEE